MTALEAMSLSIDFLILLADLGILYILVKEYYYDKLIYEAVLLKKMSTKRKITKKSQEVLEKSLGVVTNEKIEENHAEICKDIQSPKI